MSEESCEKGGHMQGECEDTVKYFPRSLKIITKDKCTRCFFTNLHKNGIAMITHENNPKPLLMPN